MPVVAITTAVGAGTAIYSSNQQSKAVKNASNQQQAAADQSIAYQREARDYAQQILSKYSVEGDAARAKMNTFLGLSPKPYAGSMGAPPTAGTNDTQAQLRAAAQRARNGDPQIFPQSTLGWVEGGPMEQAQPAADPTATPAETQEQAWNAYKETPWGRIGQMEADKAGQSFLSKAGAQGSALSGRVVRGQAELGNEAQLRNFTGYYGALGGVADTGFNADTGIASGGQQFANSAANVLGANAANQGNLGMANAQAKANGVNDLARWIGWGVGAWPQGGAAGGTSASSFAGQSSGGSGRTGGLGQFSRIS